MDENKIVEVTEETLDTVATEATGNTAVGIAAIGAAGIAIGALGKAAWDKWVSPKLKARKQAKLEAKAADEEFLDDIDDELEEES